MFVWPRKPPAREKGTCGLSSRKKCPKELLGWRQPSAKGFRLKRYSRANFDICVPYSKPLSLPATTYLGYVASPERQKGPRINRASAILLLNSLTNGRGACVEWRTQIKKSGCFLLLIRKNALSAPPHRCRFGAHFPRLTLPGSHVQYAI